MGQLSPGIPWSNLNNNKSKVNKQKLGKTNCAIINIKLAPSFRLFQPGYLEVSNSDKHSSHFTILWMDYTTRRFLQIRKVLHILYEGDVFKKILK